MRNLEKLGEDSNYCKNPGGFRKFSAANLNCCKSKIRDMCQSDKFACPLDCKNPWMSSAGYMPLDKVNQFSANDLSKYMVKSNVGSFISIEKQPKIIYFSLSNNSLNMWNSEENQVNVTTKTLFIFKVFKGIFPAHKSLHVHF